MSFASFPIVSAISGTLVVSGDASSIQSQLILFGSADGLYPVSSATYDGGSGTTTITGTTVPDATTGYVANGDYLLASSIVTMGGGSNILGVLGTDGGYGNGYGQAQFDDAQALTLTTLNADGTDTTVTFGASDGTANSKAPYDAGKSAGRTAEYNLVNTDANRAKVLLNQRIAMTVGDVAGTAAAGGGSSDTGTTTPGGKVVGVIGGIKT